MKMKKWVYYFGKKKTEGNAKMRDLLGGKGANLAEMTRIGIPVPPGFTITTEACIEYYRSGEKFPEGLKEQVQEAMKEVEEEMELKFGSKERPLLVSVRSGARVSMPGMMDTVLNLGLNDETVEGLAEMSGNRRFAYDCYRRFVQMYGDVVLGLKPKAHEIDPFEAIIDELKEKKEKKFDIELDENDMKELVERFKNLIKEKLGVEFPQDPWEQLWNAIGAVFKSWNNERAITYRRINNIPDDWGTAVNVVAMVYGNLGDNSATGVAFTRDPATGEKRFFGEYLPNAQGEDVVAGIRTPLPINKEGKSKKEELSLEEVMPDVYNNLVEIKDKLERHYKDVQDIEFTIQEGKLYLLQTRNGKRTGFASVRIAMEMLEEGLLTEEEALMKIDPEGLIQLLAPVFDIKEKEKAKKEGKYLAKGLNASPGAASGKVVFTAEDAVKMKDERTILVRLETSPEDIGGMAVAQGILTARGGMTSHAAVVARGMGKPCVAGCGALNISYERKEMKVGDKIIKQGDWISIDGTTGEVFAEKLTTYPSEVIQVFVKKEKKLEESKIAQMFNRVMLLADKYRKLGVRTNADTPEDTATAREFGAEGIGLCRTEHMFFKGDRIIAMREMILARTKEEREKALEKLLPLQRDDFAEIFRVMDGFPVVIRLLDPPLHEFLPHEDKEIEEVAKSMNVPKEELKTKVQSLKELNPMLGHRGCRLGITYPEITRMQAKAIFEAACKVKKEGVNVIPEVMVPLVGHWMELENQRKIIEEVAKEVLAREGVTLRYMIGTMIEVPRAALTADEIAKYADFFSYGTNDLTQMGCGFSRDDAGKFLPVYVDMKIYKKDPFQSLDQDGIGELIKIGIEKGRGTNPELEVGICGEHGGDPDSIEFCHKVGMDYVSCSPYRVPVARLAAAQAALKEKKKV